MWSCSTLLSSWVCPWKRLLLTGRKSKVTLLHYTSTHSIHCVSRCWIWGMCVTISLVWLFWYSLFQDQNSSPSGAGPKWAGTSSSLGCGICLEYGNWIYPSQRPSDSTRPTHTTSHYAYMTVIRVLGSCWCQLFFFCIQTHTYNCCNCHSSISIQQDK